MSDDEQSTDGDDDAGDGHEQAGNGEWQSGNSEEQGENSEERSRGSPSVDTGRSDEFGLPPEAVSERAGDTGGSDDRRDSDDRNTSDAPDTGDDRPTGDGADGDAPLSSLASSVDQRRDRDADRPDDELFSEESVPEIDTDVVWERLDEDEPPELPEETERDVRVVAKRSYCEQCPFFAAPPDVSCTHDGTEILELVDMDHFRVVDCPMVREDERLEQL